LREIPSNTGPEVYRHFGEIEQESLTEVESNARLFVQNSLDLMASSILGFVRLQPSFYESLDLNNIYQLFSINACRTVVEAFSKEYLEFYGLTRVGLRVNGYYPHSIFGSINVPNYFVDPTILQYRIQYHESCFVGPVFVGSLEKYQGLGMEVNKIMSDYDKFLFD
jgi:hypothetical protein